MCDGQAVLMMGKEFTVGLGREFTIKDYYALTRQKLQLKGEKIWLTKVPLIF